MLLLISVKKRPLFGCFPRCIPGFIASLVFLIFSDFLFLPFGFLSSSFVPLASCNFKGDFLV